jgi:hypothetical protein
LTGIKYTAETEAKIADIKALVRNAKRRIPDQCLWFERVIKDHIQRLHGSKVAIMELEIRRSGREYQDFEIADLKEMQKVIEGDILKMLDEEHAYILSQISNKRITAHQVDVLHKGLQGAAGTSLSVWYERLFGPSDGLITKQAPLVWWNWVKQLRHIPKKPAPPVPSTFYLPLSHVDKTDREGLPYYYSMGAEHYASGTPDVTSQVSMTKQAVSARKRRYAGPRLTAEQYARAEERTRKRDIKRGEEYVKQKNEQRAKAHKLEDKQREESLKKFRKEARTEEIQQAKRKEKSIKDYGDGT